MNEQPNRSSAFYPLFLAIMLVAGLFIGHSLAERSQPRFAFFDNSAGSSEKIEQVIDMIDSRYVDAIEKEELVDAVLDDLLEQLDPHSDYISQQEFLAMQEPLEGSFDGIGVEFAIQNDTVVVISPVEGGPSEALGIRAGDRFLKADSVLMHGKTISNKVVMENLRGPSNSKVVVTVYRPSSNEVFNVAITRGKIPINSIASSFMLDNETGYLKLIRFAGTTVKEFATSTDQLLEQGMKKMVLDLRGNGGGYLFAAVQLADEFLPKGRLIVYTEGRSHPKRSEYSKRDGKLMELDLVVLVDEGSASASEVLAGALQDNDRGTIVGRRTFGKGLVQDQEELDDQSAIRLTTARYYTPSGRCIQKPYGNGIDYHGEFYKRSEKGELTESGSGTQDTTEVFKTIGGRTVYGGGGIMPDVFVAVDTTEGSFFLSELFYTGVLNQFAFEHADKQRADLEAYGSAEGFASSYITPSQLIDELIAYAKEQGLKAKQEDLKRSERQIALRLKANIARNIWGANGYYPIVIESDKMKDKALEILKEQDKEKGA